MSGPLEQMRAERIHAPGQRLAKLEGGAAELSIEQSLANAIRQMDDAVLAKLARELDDGSLITLAVATLKLERTNGRAPGAPLPPKPEVVVTKELKTPNSIKPAPPASVPAPPRIANPCLSRPGQNWMDAVRAAIERSPGAARRQLERDLEISAAALTKALRWLQFEGHVERRGSTSNATYWPISSPRATTALGKDRIIRAAERAGRRGILRAQAARAGSVSVDEAHRLLVELRDEGKLKGGGSHQSSRWKVAYYAKDTHAQSSGKVAAAPKIGEASPLSLVKDAGAKDIVPCHAYSAKLMAEACARRHLHALSNTDAQGRPNPAIDDHLCVECEQGKTLAARFGKE